MKTRLGFVTNSSSSSFIISKKENLNSIDEVFSFLKTVYEEYLGKRKALIEYCKQDARFLVSEDGKKTKIELKNKKACYEERRVINDFIENEFGMSYYDIYHGEADWLKCKDYNEFARYVSESNEYFYINIVDLENPSFNDESEITSTDSLIDWYMPCFTENFAKDCAECRHKDYCYMIQCDKDVVVGAKKSSDKQELVKMYFGRFCICSECGYIPEYVVHRLGEASTFWCNHMG